MADVVGGMRDTALPVRGAPACVLRGAWMGFVSTLTMPESLVSSDAALGDRSHFRKRLRGKLP